MNRNSNGNSSSNCIPVFSAALPRTILFDTILLYIHIYIYILYYIRLVFIYYTRLDQARLYYYIYNMHILHQTILYYTRLDQTRLYYYIYIYIYAYVHTYTYTYLFRSAAPGLTSRRGRLVHDRHLYTTTNNSLQCLLKNNAYCTLNNRCICINISCGAGDGHALRMPNSSWIHMSDVEYHIIVIG